MLNAICQKNQPKSTSKKTDSKKMIKLRPDVRSCERGRQVRYKPTLTVTVSNVESRPQVRRHFESTKSKTTSCRCCCCCCCYDIVVVGDVLRCYHCLRVVAGLRLLLGQKRERSRFGYK